MSGAVSDQNADVGLIYDDLKLRGLPLYPCSRHWRGSVFIKSGTTG